MMKLLKITGRIRVQFVFYTAVIRAYRDMGLLVGLKLTWYFFLQVEI